MSPPLATAVQSVQEADSKAEGGTALPQRILIVEDEAVLAKNLKSYLSRGAADVRTAADAAQALELLESFAPDALVVDFGLPEVDGLQTYAEIVRHQERNIDCVLMSGRPAEELASQAHDLGIQHVICKPIRFSQLQTLLQGPTKAGADGAAEASLETDGGVSA